MKLLRKPPEELTVPDLVYWLERMRMIWFQMNKLSEDLKESPIVRQTAEAARDHAKFYGGKLMAELQLKAPEHEVIKKTSIPKDLNIVQQWQALEKLKPPEDTKTTYWVELEENPDIKNS